jgi:hypothetical protein
MTSGKKKMKKEKVYITKTYIAAPIGPRAYLSGDEQISRKKMIILKQQLVLTIISCFNTMKQSDLISKMEHKLVSIVNSSSKAK